MKIRIKQPIWGVPITYLEKHDRKKFEIIGSSFSKELEIKEIGSDALETFFRSGGKGHYTPVMTNLYYKKKGVPVFPYRRILIRKK